MRFPLRSIFAASAVFATLGIAIGADEPGESVTVDGLIMQVPAAWKKVKPSNAMRKAQYEVGSPDPAEFTISSFGGGGGGAKANIERWKGQFKSKEGKAVEVETKTMKVSGFEITRVEVAGTYTDPFSKAGPKPDSRLLGAIVADDRSSYFLKLIGPEKAVLAAEPGFDALLKSVKAEKE